MKHLPIIAIPIGDPSGIGPEVVIKAIAKQEIHQICKPLVIGNQAILQAVLKQLGLNTPIRNVSVPPYTFLRESSVNFIDIKGTESKSHPIGVVSPSAGQASVEWVKLAANLCISGFAEAMATAPINKESVSLAGYTEVGHMEILQSLTQSVDVATMLISGNLRVVHLTTHRSLKTACDAVTKDNILSIIKLTHNQFTKWNFPTPYIAVAALNPHGSDGGLIGEEESTAITPGIIEAKKLGINVCGPIPADSLFYQATKGEYDVVIAMYHDQGHIPIKVYGFEKSISVNLGLPIIRTSVDHGTAFDIAGKGTADESSMIEAIKMATSLALGKGLLV
jgi:4-hydroxythreonine-4-phosphate dehydrogenase